MFIPINIITHKFLKKLLCFPKLKYALFKCFYFFILYDFDNIINIFSYHTIHYIKKRSNFIKFLKIKRKINK